MSTLIPSIELVDFRKYTSEQIRELKSVEITEDGNYLCTMIIPPFNSGATITGNIKTQAEYLAMRGNTVGGKDPSMVEVMIFNIPVVESTPEPKADPLKCKKCGKVCRTNAGLHAHQRKHNYVRGGINVTSL
jgi:hypothetical protein